MSAYWYNPLLQSVELQKQVSQNVTGVSATGSIGFAFVGNPTTGLAGTSSIGNVTISGDASVLVTGLGMVANLGAVGSLEFSVQGVEAVMSIGTVTVESGGAISVEVTGVNGVVGVGSLRSWTDIPNSQSTVWTNIA